jgi:hypothetical protein
MRVALLLSMLPLLGGCAFSSTARQWNTRVGPQGEAVYYKNTSKVGFNLLVFVPFLGDLGVNGIVRDLTEHIEEESGDVVRIVQGSTENYWYGWPPFTWILTPVITTVAAEYRPSEEELAKYLAVEETETWAWYMPWTW